MMNRETTDAAGNYPPSRTHHMIGGYELNEYEHAMLSSARTLETTLQAILKELRKLNAPPPRELSRKK